MDKEFWTLNLGNLITFASVIIAYLALRQAQKKDKSDQIERSQDQHQQNLEKLNVLRVQIAAMGHLDECLDSLREEVREIRTYVMNLLQKRGSQ